MARKGAIGAGIFVLIIGIIGIIMPVNDFGHSVVDLHNLCTSGIGQLAQFFGGQQVIQNCQTAKGATYLVLGLAGIGTIIIIIGAVVSSKPRTWICEYCNYATSAEAEMINHKNEKHLDKLPYICEHCDFIGKTEEELWNHYNDKHPKEKKW